LEVKQGEPHRIVDVGRSREQLGQRALRGVAMEREELELVGA
jgi:hypothetical protein